MSSVKSARSTALQKSLPLEDAAEGAPAKANGALHGSNGHTNGHPAATDDAADHVDHGRGKRRATAESMAAVGLSPGVFWAWIVGLLELLGGVAIVLGVLTRWTALVLAMESLVVIIGAWQLANVEFRLAALAAFVALALLGPQQYALDLKSPRLASWSRVDVDNTRGPASKAA